MALSNQPITGHHGALLWKYTKNIWSTGISLGLRWIQKKMRQIENQPNFEKKKLKFQICRSSDKSDMTCGCSLHTFDFYTSEVLPPIMTTDSFTTSPRLTHLSVSVCNLSLSLSQAWNVLALDGSNWQKIDLFNFQTDIEVREGRLCVRKEKNTRQWCVGKDRQCFCVGPSVCCWSVRVFIQCCWEGSVADWDITAGPFSSLSSHLTNISVVSVSLRAGWWRTFPSVAEASWGSWASEAASASETLPWSERSIVCPDIHTLTANYIVVLHWLLMKTIVVPVCLLFAALMVPLCRTHVTLF